MRKDKNQMGFTQSVRETHQCADASSAAYQLSR